jgi:hypothetical protein
MVNLSGNDSLKRDFIRKISDNEFSVFTKYVKKRGWFEDFLEILIGIELILEK